MADDATLTNQQTSFTGNTNPDIPVRARETVGGKKIQAVYLDIGSGSSESPVVGSLPISGTVNQGTPLASGSGWRITEYGTSGLSNFYWNIAGILEIPTVVIGDPFSGSPWTFLNGAGAIHGSTAHDAVDTNYPVKIGGKAASDGITWPTAVASGDRVDGFYDTSGFEHVKDHGQTDGGTDLTALNTTFNNVTTTASSADVTTLGYRFADLCFAISSGGVGTHYVTITAQAKIGSSYFTMRCGFLGKFIIEDTAVATKQYMHVRFPCPDADALRITITATNTTALLTFTVEEAHIRLST